MVRNLCLLLIVSLVLAGCGSSSSLDGGSVISGPLPTARAETVFGHVEMEPGDTGQVEFFTLEGSPLGAVRQDGLPGPIPVDSAAGTFTAVAALPANFKILATLRKPDGSSEVLHSQYHGDHNGKLLRVNLLTDLAAAHWDLPSEFTHKESQALVKAFFGLPEGFSVRHSVGTYHLDASKYRNLLRQLGGGRTRSGALGRDAGSGLAQLAQAIDNGQSAASMGINLGDPPPVDPNDISSLDEFNDPDFQSLIASGEVSFAESVGSLGRSEEEVEVQRGIQLNPEFENALTRNGEQYRLYGAIGELRGESAVAAFGVTAIVGVVAIGVTFSILALRRQIQENKAQKRKDQATAVAVTDATYIGQASKLTAATSAIETANSNLNSDSAAATDSQKGGTYVPMSDARIYPSGIATLEQHLQTIADVLVGNSGPALLALAGRVVNPSELYSVEALLGQRDHFAYYANLQGAGLEALAQAYRAAYPPQINSLVTQARQLGQNHGLQRAFLPWPCPASNFVVDTKNQLVWFRVLQPYAKLKDARSLAASFNWSNVTGWRVATHNDLQASFGSNPAGPAGGWSQLHGFDFTASEKSQFPGRYAGYPDVVGAFTFGGKTAPIGDWAGDQNWTYPYLLVRGVPTYSEVLNGEEYGELARLMWKLIDVQVSVDPVYNCTAKGVFQSPDGGNVLLDITDRVQWKTSDPTVAEIFNESGTTTRVLPDKTANPNSTTSGPTFKVTQGYRVGQLAWKVGSGSLTVTATFPGNGVTPGGPVSGSTTVTQSPTFFLRSDSVTVTAKASRKDSDNNDLVSRVYGQLVAPRLPFTAELIALQSDRLADQFGIPAPYFNQGIPLQDITHASGVSWTSSDPGTIISSSAQGQGVTVTVQRRPAASNGVVRISATGQGKNAEGSIDILVTASPTPTPTPTPQPGPSPTPTPAPTPTPNPTPTPTSPIVSVQLTPASTVVTKEPSVTFSLTGTRSSGATVDLSGDDQTTWTTSDSELTEIVRGVLTIKKRPTRSAALVTVTARFLTEDGRTLNASAALQIKPLLVEGATGASNRILLRR